MDQARSVSKKVESLMMEQYSMGAITPHYFTPGDEEEQRVFWSWPDSEAVISAANNFQDDENLMDFAEQFKDKEFTYGEEIVKIQNIKVTYPHTSNVHTIVAPHPDMDDEELKRYIWPNDDLNANGVHRDYVGGLWIDIGEPDTDLTVQTEEGVFKGISRSSEKWVRVLDLPIQVGTNKCNLAAIRSYLLEPEYKERVMYILKNIVRYEARLPDGYFIVSGTLKKFNITDKLMMNTPYTVRVAQPQQFGSRKVTPLAERLCEVRSLRPSVGLSFLRLILLSDIKDPKIEGSDPNIFKFYNSAIYAMIDTSEFESPVNVFNVIQAYGSAVMAMDGVEAMNDLLKAIRKFCANDTEIMTIVLNSYTLAKNMSDEVSVSLFKAPVIKGNTGMDTEAEKQEYKRRRISYKLLPHCHIEGDEEGTYNAKVRFLAMMVIELLLTAYDRKPLTNRKSYVFKRWESAGYQLREYVRDMFMRTGKTEKTRKKISSLVASRNVLVQQLMHKNEFPTQYVSMKAYHKSDRSKKFGQTGIIDNIPKYNAVSVLDAVRTVKIVSAGGMNTGAVRRIDATQWGFQCPANTPENDNIGYNNNLAEACIISDVLTAKETSTLNAIIEGFEELSDNEDSVLLVLDGNPIKYVSSSAYEDLMDLRREGRINRGIGISLYIMWHGELQGIPTLVVRTSHGRPLFPAFVLNEDPDRYDELLALGDDERSFDDLIYDGLIEYLDGHMLTYNAVVADWFYTRDSLGKFVPIDPVQYTHIMIKPEHICSQATNCISFLEHNPAARGTYASIHVKQSIGRPFMYESRRYDHEMNYLKNPEPPLVTTDTSRRVGMGSLSGMGPIGRMLMNLGAREGMGIGRNVRILAMSNFGNVNDGVHFSETLVNSHKFDGTHYNIFSSDKAVGFGSNRYNIKIDPVTLQEIVDPQTGMPLNDPDFSDSVIVPYGEPYITEIESTDPRIAKDKAIDLYDLYRDERLLGVVAFQIEPGKLHIRYGFRTIMYVQYLNPRTGTLTERREINPGEDIMSVPGLERTEELGPKMVKMALAYVREDLRESIETKFLDPVPVFRATDSKGVSRNWYGPGIVRISRTRDSQGISTNTGRLVTIRMKRSIKRGDTAIKVLQTESITNRIIGIEKERFEITEGYIDDITYGAPTKIRCAMPIGPKVGNKYAALYAQKGVCAKIIPANEVPLVAYTDSTGKEHTIEPEVVFNPLSFPTRMTIGMMYEMLISGAVYHVLVDLNLREIFESDPDSFDILMSERYSITDAHKEMEYFMDTTPFIYDNEEKLQRCMNFREKLGIPKDGMYDVYLPDPEGNYNRKVKTKVFFGTVYYVALRHLVDNKRRARGYVGRRDPLTLQPVKGRRKDGGSKFGLMESDALKAHGAGYTEYERLAKASDARTFHKCTRCGGVSAHNKQINTYRCTDCAASLTPAQVIEHESVHSYFLWNTYLRAIGIELKETFE